MALKFVALAMLITAQAITIRRTHKPEYTISGDHITVDSHGGSDSKAGTPAVVPWEGKALFKQTPWQANLGDRLFKAATVDKKAWDSCGSFISFGDSSWCAKAMPEQKDKVPIRGMHFYDLQKSVSESTSTTSSADLVGLSYGIQGSDLWSETMSNTFNLKTKLYDCYFSTPEGPMYDGKNLYSETGCAHNQRGCYSTPYEANHVCVDEGSSDRIVAKNGRSYEPLSLALKDRKPLSVHLKIDVEGSEWPVLEKLLKSEEDMAKIRTLDMELHLQKEPTPDGNRPQNDEAGVTRRVVIMEELAKKFAVTGSSIEHQHQTGQTNFMKKLEEDPKFENKEPGLVYTSNGYSMDQYCVSYVNPKLL